MDNDLLAKLLTQLVEGQNTLIKKLDSVIVPPGPEKEYDEKGGQEGWVEVAEEKVKKKKGRPKSTKGAQEEPKNDTYEEPIREWKPGPVKASGVNEFEKMGAFNSYKGDIRTDQILGQHHTPRKPKVITKKKLTTVYCRGCSKATELDVESNGIRKDDQGRFVYMCQKCIKERGPE